MNRNARWKILGLRGVPPKLINLMSELYFGTESAVRCGNTISDLFPVVTGVCQGCILVPHTRKAGEEMVQDKDHRPACGERVKDPKIQLHHGR